jgi:hypothetical protein
VLVETLARHLCARLPALGCNYYSGPNAQHPDAAILRAALETEKTILKQTFGEFADLERKK